MSVLLPTPGPVPATCTLNAVYSANYSHIVNAIPFALALKNWDGTNYDATNLTSLFVHGVSGSTLPNCPDEQSVTVTGAAGAEGTVTGTLTVANIEQLILKQGVSTVLLSFFGQDGYANNVFLGTGTLKYTQVA